MLADTRWPAHRVKRPAASSACPQALDPWAGHDTWAQAAWRTAHMTRNHWHTEIEMQVMWNRLISVVEEQARTLVRTAFGTATREAGDLSAGVYNRAGDM